LLRYFILQKWVNRNGFVIELSLGGGRYLGDNDDSLSPEGFFRGGVSFGLFLYLSNEYYFL